MGLANSRYFCLEVRMAICLGCGKDVPRVYNSACRECLVDSMIRRDAFVRSQSEKDRVARDAFKTDLEEKALMAFDDAMLPIRNIAAVLTAGEEECVQRQMGELIEMLAEKAEARFAQALREGSLPDGGVSCE